MIWTEPPTDRQTYRHTEPIAYNLFAHVLWGITSWSMWLTVILLSLVGMEALCPFPYTVLWPMNPMMTKWWPYLGSNVSLCGRNDTYRTSVIRTSITFTGSTHYYMCVYIHAHMQLPLCIYPQSSSTRSLSYFLTLGKVSKSQKIIMNWKLAVAGLLLNSKWTS